MLAATLVTSTALLLPAAATAADAPASTTVERVSAAVQPAIVYETITFSTKLYDNLTNRWLLNAKPVELEVSCTGFFVTPDGHVATAGHCVVWDADLRNTFLEYGINWAYQNGFYSDNPSKNTIRTVAFDDWQLRDRSRAIEVSYGVAASGIPQPQTRPARLLASRAFDKGDVALVRIEGRDLPALELAPESDVNVGTEAISVGFPAVVDDLTDANRFNPSFKEGSVSSVKTIGGGLLDVYEISAAVAPGMSGGPTVDSEGHVIGVNSFRPSNEPQAFNFIAPAELVAELMTDKGVENAVGETNAHYLAGLDAYFAGDRDEAIDEFDAVLAKNQSHELAQQYREAATELEEEGGFPLLWVVLVLGVLALAAAGAAVALRRRGALGAPAIAGVPSGASGAPAGTQAPPGPAPTPPAAAATATGDAKPALVVVGPRGETAVRHQLEGEMVIGREAADILLSDEQVSRRHAQIRVADGGLELTDLGSANGTEVNGQRITTSTVTLGHGDTIKVGNTELRVELPPSMRGPRPSGATVIAPRGDS